MKKIIAILNAISLVLVIIFNFLSIQGVFNDTDISQASEKYMNLFFPAGYAFSIWSLIYTLLIIYVGYQIRVAFGKKKSVHNFIEQTGPWFVLSSVCNIFWILAFTSDQIGWSLVFIMGLLFCLAMIVRNTGMETWNSPPAIHAFTWTPIGIYIGWITSASIANVFIYITKHGWNLNWLTIEQFSYLGLFFATIIYTLVILNRRMREYGLVGVWALIAIYMRNQNGNEGFALTALFCSILILLVVIYSTIKNRETVLWSKLSKGKSALSKPVLL